MNKFTVMGVAVLLAVFAQGEVLVQWGSVAGETDIVTATTINNANNMQTTWDGDLLTGVYVGYYPNAGTTRSPKIYGAGSMASEEVEIVDDASGDYFRTSSNVSGSGYNYQGMLVWQDFLAPGREVTDFSIMVGGYYNNSNTGTVRWLVEQDGQWYVSTQTYAFDSTGYAAHSADISSLTWNLFTPFSGGTAVIGASASLALTNVSSAGFYFDVSCPTDKNFAGVEVQYFSCGGSSGPKVRLFILH